MITVIEGGGAHQLLLQRWRSIFQVCVYVCVLRGGGGQQKWRFLVKKRKKERMGTYKWNPQHENIQCLDLGIYLVMLVFKLLGISSIILFLLVA